MNIDSINEGIKDLLKLNCIASEIQVGSMQHFLDVIRPHVRIESPIYAVTYLMGIKVVENRLYPSNEVRIIDQTGKTINIIHLK